MEEFQQELLRQKAKSATLCNIQDTATCVEVAYYFNLNLKGMVTFTATGPLFIIAGENTHFHAA